MLFRVANARVQVQWRIRIKWTGTTILYYYYSYRPPGNNTVFVVHVQMLHTKTCALVYVAG